ncbi:MAG: OmpA family protein [Myxococcota bacterium]
MTTDRRGSALPWFLLVLVVALVAAAVWFGKPLYDAERARAEAEKARADAAVLAADEAKRAIGESNAKLKDVEEHAQALQQKVDALSTEKEDLSRELEAAEAEVKRLKATYDTLEQKMHEEIRKGEIRLTNAEGKIRVDLVDKVLFDSGKADISTHGEEVLARLGAVLATVDDKMVQVSGHTDDSPIALPELKEKFPTNWELSASRAVNVVRFLTEKGGVPAKRLSAAAWAHFQPVATNATPAGRAQNRRIEILLVPVVARVAAAPVARPATAAPAKPAAVKPVKKR